MSAIKQAYVSWLHSLKEDHPVLYERWRHLIEEDDNGRPRYA